MPRKWVLFCGGTGMHGALDAFVNSTLSAVDDTETSISLHVVVPITDDGNSSRAITDCFGGPALGDLRNVTLRVAKAAARVRPTTVEGFQLGPFLDLLSHRVSHNDEYSAAKEFEKTQKHVRECNLTNEARISIVASALHVFNEAAERQAKLGLPMRYRNASVGNCVLLGLWIQCGSLRRAMEAFSELVCIPSNIVILPSIECVYDTAMHGQQPRWRLVAECASDPPSTLVGQCAISYGGDAVDKAASANPIDHPVRAIRVECISPADSSATPQDAKMALDNHWSVEAALPSRTDAIIFGRGSFLSSVVAAAVPLSEWLQRQHNVPRVLLMNSTVDRELSWCRSVRQMLATLDASIGSSTDSVSHIIFPKGSKLMECFCTVSNCRSSELSECSDGCSTALIACKSRSVEHGCVVFNDEALFSMLVSLVRGNCERKIVQTMV